jgi:hypothetical protein
MPSESARTAAASRAQAHCHRPPLQLALALADRCAVSTPSTEFVSLKSLKINDLYG